MHIVILGAGVVGTQIAYQLIAESKDVVLIERDKTRAQDVGNRLDCIVINEEGTNIASLKKAEMDKADIFISVTNSDEVNMVACGLVASEFPNVRIKIARIRNLDYSAAKIVEKTFLGIDYVVNPEVETVRHIATTAAFGAESDVVLFENTDLQMRNMLIDEQSLFLNQPLKDLRLIIKKPFLVAGIIRDSDFIIPSGDTVINKNDTLYLLSNRYDFPKIFMQSGQQNQDEINSIVIVGGGKIGSLLCKEFLNADKKITIVEKNYELCKELSAAYPDVLVLNGDISDEDIYREENLGSYDLMVTTTDNQELNIITSIYAKRKGIKRCIALVEKSNYISIAAELNIDSIISPKSSTVDAIMKYIRRGDIKSVHSIFNGKAEVIEFSIDDDNIMAGQALMDIKLPANTIVLSVVRRKRTHLPTGSFVILPGDVVIIISSKESIGKLEKSFLD